MLYFKVFAILEIIAWLFYLVISTYELMQQYFYRKKKGWVKRWKWSVYNLDASGIAFLVLLPLIIAIPITILGYGFSLFDAIIEFLKNQTK